MTGHKMTACQITNLVVNFEYLLLLCFLTEAEFLNLGHIQGIINSKDILLGELDFFQIRFQCWLKKRSKQPFKIQH